MEKQIKRIPVNFTKAPREIVFDERDWLLSGETFNWAWYVEERKLEVVLERW